MVKRKHYDQSYKEAIVAEMLGGKSAARLRSVRELPPTHFTSGKS